MTNESNTSAQYEETVYGTSVNIFLSFLP